jgi:hypothetical protein
VGKEEAGEQDADQHAFGQVMRADRHHDGGQHYHAGAFGVFAQVANRAPVEGADGHHDHHRDQRGHWNTGHPVTDEDDHQQQEHASSQC